MTTAAQDFINAEMKRRTDLVESEEFRTKCVEVAKKLGITPKEWNENKAAILLFMANEYCKIENTLIN
jgi:hypothetical protein